MFTATIDQIDENLCLPEPGDMAAKLAVLLALQAIPLSRAERRIIYCIKNNYYRKGHCHARQDQIAKTCKLGRMTFQRAYYSLERRKLIIVVRQQGQSNITYLAPGVAEALHDLFLEESEQLRPRKHAGSKKKTKVASQKKPAKMRLCSLPKNHEPQATPYTIPSVDHDLSEKSTSTNIQHSGEKEKNEPVSEPHVAVPAPPEKKQPSEEEQQAIEQLKAINMQEPQELIEHHGLELVIKHLHAKGYLAPGVANQAGWLRKAIQENYQYPAPLPKVDHPLAQSPIEKQIAHPLVVELVQAGVHHFEAAMAVKIWPAERIQAQLQSGEYLQANNPPAFLIEAIRRGFTTRPKPGSEHALVYAKEQPAKSLTPSHQSTPPPVPPDPIAQLQHAFAQLAVDRQQAFEEQAHQKLKANPPPHISHIIARDPATYLPLRSVIRMKAMELWQASQKKHDGGQWNHAA